MRGLGKSDRPTVPAAGARVLRPHLVLVRRCDHAATKRRRQQEQPLSKLNLRGDAANGQGDNTNAALPFPGVGDVVGGPPAVAVGRAPPRRVHVAPERDR